MKKRILITGINGLIGWNLFCEARKHHTTYGTYRRYHPILQETPNVFYLNIENPSELQQEILKINPEYVIHAWGMCDLDVCESVPDNAKRVNVEGTQQILKFAKAIASLKKFVYISTDHVFDGQLGQYDENAKPNPIHVYGKTKYNAEKLVENSGLPFLIIRPGLIIGESLQGNKGPRDFLFSRIRADKETHYFTDEWRSPIAAEEFSQLALNIIFSTQNGTFHIAGDEAQDRFSYARALAAQHGLSNLKIKPRLRQEDKWAHIRPKDLSLRSLR